MVSCEAVTDEFNAQKGMEYRVSILGSSAGSPRLNAFGSNTLKSRPTVQHPRLDPTTNQVVTAG